MKAYHDPIEEWVSSVVKEQIACFKAQRITRRAAHQALTGSKYQTSLPTWGELAELIEDKYCKLNQLHVRR